ncbi:MAG: hypothetical protein H6650_11865 [Ardenticatenales bacterium]|nr:hypothetical protein [Ardenticatenales bacterium]
MKRLPGIIVRVLVGVLVVVVSAGIFFTLNTRRLPNQSAISDRLSPAEKARLAELFHLRQTVGESVWPGWGQADIPVIAYNESYAFLLGLDDPAVGWLQMPQNRPRGGPWEMVPGDTFLGRPYYRQELTNGITPQAFTVRVGEVWVASLQTKEWLEIALRQQTQAELPAPLDQALPYAWLIPPLIGHTEGYIAKVAHETFHAYQGQVAPERLDNAETAQQSYASRYPWNDPLFTDDWRQELSLLAAALEADSPADRTELVRRFLAQRDHRRLQRGLPAAGEIYERQREWLEGMALYVELATWRQASQSDYAPLPELVALDADFYGYGDFDGQWRRAISTLRRQANQGDTRFYYSGMAQAFLLDALLPGWKDRIMEGGVWLEGLLAEAVAAAD